MCATPRQQNGSAASFEKDFAVKEPRENVLARYDLEFFS